MKLKWFFFISATVLVAQAAAQTQPGIRLGLALMEQFKQGDATGAAAFYAKDALLFTPSTGPLVGRDAIRKDTADFLAHFRVLSVKVTYSKYTVAGNICYGGGTGTMLVKPAAGGDSITLTTRFTDVQRRTKGKWLYVTDHLSMVPAPQK